MIKKLVNKHLILVNVISSGSQVLIIGVVYFFLYKILLKNLGIELLGVWSVVLSTSSLANLANFGVADSVIRFVALFTKDDKRDKMRKLIFTASLFLFGLFLIIGLIIFPFADLILRGVLPIKYLKEGLLILPYSITCLILNAVNGVYASVLDGMQKNYLRTLIFSTSSIVLLATAFLLVPIYKLQGVAFAQVLQSFFTLISCLICVVFQTKYNPLKWNWDKAIFKQIFSYGMKFQFVSLASMLNDPITKILLGKFGGMAFVGFYEMANRLLVQARGVIVSGTQSLIPVMINFSNNVAEIQVFYKKIFSNVLFFSIAAMGIIVVSGRLVSYFWIGQYQTAFYFSLLILSVSTLLNLTNAPAYFFNMAEGNLNVLIKQHVILGFSNAVFAYVLGYLFQGYGVILGWLIAILLGGIYILNSFNKDYSLKFKDILNLKDLLFTLWIIVIVVLCGVNKINNNFKIVDAGFLLLTFLSIALYFFKYKINDIVSLRRSSIKEIEIM